MSTVIDGSTLRKLVNQWIAGGKTVVAPVGVGRKTHYKQLRSADAAVLDPHRRPANSIKEFFFPRHERLFRFRFEGKQVQLIDETGEDREMVVLATRPCDAAALLGIDQVFNWDAKDEFYTRRRDRTTIVTLACASADDACFCTSVGLGPDNESGSDAVLADLGDGSYEVRIVMEKGRELFGSSLRASDRKAPLPAEPLVRIDLAEVGTFLRENFDSPFWSDESLACLGCGSCAYTCPACHCFDIADEGNVAGGARVKNWDSCQFTQFTLHASGHNPRPTQAERQRQRIYHKFSVFPSRFGSLLCTGCGNCTRNCPAGLGVLPVLEAMKGEVTA